MHDPYFDELAPLFHTRGFRLFIVGGTSRDLLLGRDYSDHDFATDATPDEMRAFLPQADYSFARFGSVRVRGRGGDVDITTMREEGDYKDHRHPSSVRFVKDPALDYKRRDFTINAVYLDENYLALDYCGGIDDLKSKTIRFIGDPRVRIEEDPLRILRGERFAAVLGFQIEEGTKAAMDELRPLLKELNPEKVKEEERKLREALHG
jgi:tRNA nucleotidyltransferase/poly(A) polymerase